MVTVVLADGEPSSLMEAWAGQDHVVIIDASASGSRPGTVRRFDVARGPLPVRRRSTPTCGCGLSEAVEKARLMDQLPKSLVVFGIEGRSFDPGSDLSPEVVAVVDEVVARALEECEVEP
jgi:hydrogenase maturation protease